MARRADDLDLALSHSSKLDNGATLVARFGNERGEHCVLTTDGASPSLTFHCRAAGTLPRVGRERSSTLSGTETVPIDQIRHVCLCHACVSEKRRSLSKT